MATKYFNMQPVIVDDVLYLDANTTSSHEVHADDSYRDQRVYFENDVVNDLYHFTVSESDGRSYNLNLDYGGGEYSFNIEITTDGTNVFQTYFELKKSHILYIGNAFADSDCKTSADIDSIINLISLNVDSSIGSFDSETYDVLPLFTHYFDTIKNSLNTYSSDELNLINNSLSSLVSDCDVLDSSFSDVDNLVSSLYFDMDILTPDIESLIDDNTNKFEIDHSNDDTCIANGSLVTVVDSDIEYKVVSSSSLNLGDSFDHLYYLENSSTIVGSPTRFYCLGSNLKKVVSDEV